MHKSRSTSLTQGPISATLFRLTLPMILGIFSIVALNLVDAFFVGKLGALQLAALGFAFPVIMVMGSIGLGIGTGASAVISRAIGEKDVHKTRCLTRDSLSLSLLLALLFVVLGLCTMTPLFRAMGASEAVLAHIKAYMYTWYVGVLFVMVPFVGNNALRANGDMRTPAMIMLFMVVINVLLDPLLMFGWGPIPALGMAGAALATVISRAMSLILCLYVLHVRKHMISLALPSRRELWTSWRPILRIGLPASATNLLVPLSTGIITWLIAQYGPEAVAAVGVASRIDVFALVTVVALANVLAPFVGQNIGANQWDRVRTAIHRSQAFALIWGGAMLLLCWLGARWVAPFFSDDPLVIQYLILYLSITPLGYAARGIYAVGNTTLNVLNRPFLASSVTLLQVGALYVPLAFLGSYLWGLPGIFVALVLSYFMAALVSFLLIQRELSRQDTATAQEAEPLEEVDWATVS